MINFFIEKGVYVYFVRINKEGLILFYVVVDYGYFDVVLVFIELWIVLVNMKIKFW